MTALLTSSPAPAVCSASPPHGSWLPLSCLAPPNDQRQYNSSNPKSFFVCVTTWRHTNSDYKIYRVSWKTVNWNIINNFIILLNFLTYFRIQYNGIDVFYGSQMETPQLFSQYWCLSLSFISELFFITNGNFLEHFRTLEKNQSWWAKNVLGKWC